MSKPTTLLGRAGPLIAARLASGCITLVIPLALARVLPQVEYGTYKLLFLVALTAGAVLPFGMAQSLYFFVPRAPEPRVYLRQTLAFMAVTGALGGLALYLAGPWLAAVLSTPGLAAHRRELAAYAALHVAALPLEPFITSRGRTRVAAAIYLGSDALRAAALVVPALAGAGLPGMLWAMTGLSALRVLVVWALLLRGRPGAPWDGRALRAQLAYALPFGLAILFAIPQQYAHQFIVAHAVGPALFAVYAVACFELPFVDLFYTPTGEVLMVQLGELERAGRRAEGVAAFREAVGHLAGLILPPVAFVFAVAPEFITTAFGARFAGAAPLFRICLLVMPLGVWPFDATLRARDQTRHIFRTYVIKAALSIPLVALATARFGLRGAAISFVASELLGRALLAWRVPAALSSPGARVRLRDLPPWPELLRAGAAAAVLAAAGAAALHAVPAGGARLARLLPLGAGSAVFGAGYLALHALGGGRGRALLRRAGSRLRPLPAAAPPSPLAPAREPAEAPAREA